MSLNADRSFKMKMRDVENAFKYRRIPYPKRSVELIALLAISCTFFLFMHTNKLNSRLKEMEVKLQPSEFSALGLTGNHISSHDGGKHDDINTLHGTYEYLKSTGQLKHLTPAHLNNTPRAQVDTLFFNRVPKTGSEKMMKLLKMLARRNDFVARRDVEKNVETIILDWQFERNLIKEILYDDDAEGANSYTKHVAYIDFETASGAMRPIYMNLIRDPIERLVSWFYYVRAPWYIAQRVAAYGKAYRVPNLKMLKKDFNRCILEHDEECVYRQNEMDKLGDHRRQLLFFCGQDVEVCMPFNSYEAMQRAKLHVETQYAVVGTWEDTNVTLTVLEHYIPRFFAGAQEVYYQPENQLHKTNRNAIRPQMSDQRKPRNVRSRQHRNIVQMKDDQDSAEQTHQHDHQHGYGHIHGQRDEQSSQGHGHKHQANLVQPDNDLEELAALKNEDDDYLDDDDDDDKNDDAKATSSYDDDSLDNGLNPLLLNNTKKAGVDFVFFNRVPKVGSQSLMELMGRLGKINGYAHSRDKAKPHETIMLKPQLQKELITELVTRNKPHAYSQHISYINFTRFHLPKPIYINLVRDPIERLISWHYYVRARWYYIDMKKKLGDGAPEMPPDEFLDMDMDTCVRTNDKACQFVQMQIRNLVGDHRRQTLFFCGQNNKLCMPFNSPAAMQKAKRTVEEDYAVVGTWEDTNITLTVLEQYIPRYFRHAKVTYYLGQDRLSRVNRNNVKKPVSDETRAILRKNLTNEIEFYEFCKQRLYLQYAAINKGMKFDNDDYLMVPEQRLDRDYNNY